MNNLFIFFKMAIKIAESALKRRVGRVSGNTGIFFRPKISNYRQVKVRFPANNSNVEKYQIHFRHMIVNK